MAKELQIVLLLENTCRKENNSNASVHVEDFACGYRRHALFCFPHFVMPLENLY